MKKSLQFYVHWGLFVLLSIGILKTSGASKAFAHTLDLHGDEARIKEKAERRMREESEKREEARYWKEYHERQNREKKEKEERESKREEEKKRRKEEERKAWQEHHDDLDRHAQEKKSSK